MLTTADSPASSSTPIRTSFSPRWRPPRRGSPPPGTTAWPGTASPRCATSTPSFSPNSRVAGPLARAVACGAVGRYVGPIRGPQSPRLSTMASTRGTTVIERESVVDAPADEVWQRVVTPEGINDELRSWMAMSMPRGAESMTVDNAPIGRAWLRLFGVLPFDYDRLTIAELQPGRAFREESTMLSMRRWQHERSVTPTAAPKPLSTIALPSTCGQGSVSPRRRSRPPSVRCSAPAPATATALRRGLAREHRGAMRLTASRDTPNTLTDVRHHIRGTRPNRDVR
jgi:hypothetical protein